MRIILIPLSLLLTAASCGNPIPKVAAPVPGDNGLLAIALAPGAEADVQSVTVGDGLLTLTTCIFHAGATLYLGESTNLDEVTIPLLAGQWCTLDIQWSGTVQIEATSTDGGILAADLSLDSISINTDDGFTVDGHKYVLEIGTPGWIDATLLEMTSDTSLEIDDTHPLASAIVEALQTGSTLYPDFDGNGLVSEDERLHPSASAGGDEGDTGLPDEPADTGASDSGVTE